MWFHTSCIKEKIPQGNKYTENFKYIAKVKQYHLYWFGG